MVYQLALALPLIVGQPDFSRIEAEVQAAIAEKKLPGAVVLVVHRDKIVYRQAFGQRAVEPSPEPMTVDTVFDLASLTKPVATTTAIMLLMEEGKLKPGDRVAQHRPRFGQTGKESLTIEHLLLHTSGLIADNPLQDYADGRGKALERIDALKPLAAPGERFIYSDVNYIVLGELVQMLSGKPLNEFVSERLFVPLGMSVTGFKPSAAWAPRIAPTEQRDGRWLRGDVHDPRAAALGGVAGHAGLFGTADDLARLARMLLHGGELEGKRIFKRETVETFVQPRPVPGGLRTYGWDVDTQFSSNRGERFPKGKSYGHTGFTGTSLWIDPTSQTVVIFLSNRVHPDGKGNVNALRGRVATLVGNVLVP
jgi:CubicO group peptidase (beta-lactamase class C family)